MGIIFKVLMIAPMLVIRSPACAEQLHSHHETSFQSCPAEELSKKQFSTKKRTASSELLSIPSYHLKTVKQPYNSLSELFDAAPPAQRELENMVGKVAKGTSAQLLSSGIKNTKRAAVKVEKELSGDASLITDIVRVTLATNSIQSLNRAYHKITRSAQTLSVMNRFDAPRPSGYRDIKILVKLPQTQLIAEVQLHLSEILDIKNEKEHDIYREIQGIERGAITSSRQLNQDETFKIHSLRQSSRRLYDVAWQGYHFA